MQNLKDYLKSKQTLVNLAIPTFLPKVDPYAKKVLEAMHYSLMAGGKRLRPILALAAAEAVNGDAKKALPAACALEFIHTYSLIHDDLPAMDDDDLRRGKPTCHKVFDEATAILAGDGLLTEAFAVLSNMDLFPNVDSKVLLKVNNLVANAMGVNGMVGGQEADMEGAIKEINAAMLDYIHKNKTAAAIKTALMVGAMLGGGSESEIESLAKYGELIGLAFQVTDDILDETSTREELGKSIGKDKEQNKATYVKLFGLDESRKKAQELVDEAVLALEDFDEKAWPLREIARYIVKRNY